MEAVTKQQAPYTQQDHYYGPYQSSHSSMASLHSYWTTDSPPGSSTFLQEAGAAWPGFRRPREHTYLASPTSMETILPTGKVYVHIFFANHVRAINPNSVRYRI